MARNLDWNLRQSLVWETEKPFFDRPRESPTFYFQDYSCHLELVFKSDANLKGEDRWYFLGIHTETLSGNRNVLGRTCNVTVYVKRRNETVVRLQSHNLKLFSYDVIWSAAEADILRKIPELDSDGLFRFFVIFDDCGAEHELSLESEKDQTFKPDEQPCQNKDRSTRLNVNSLRTSASHVNPNLCLEILSEDLHELLKEDSSKDVELKCGEHTTSAHKILLCSRSPVFRQMLQSDMEEGRTSLVEIGDMDHDVLVDFLRYLYTGTLSELTTTTAMRLFEAGDNYEVEALMVRCSEFLEQNLSPENACQVLSLADAHSDRDFKEEILVYVLDKKIPWMGDIWHNFCRSHPVLANEVLNRFCNMFCPR